MLDSIWEAVATPLGYLLNFCQYLIGDVLHLPSSYVFALLLFALIVKILFFPLALKQQRTMAAASVYKPMIDEIERKNNGNRKKMGEDLQKLEQEFGYKPATGFLSFFVQFPVILGFTELIRNPLRYILRLPKDMIDVLKTAAAEKISIAASAKNIEAQIISILKNNPAAFTEITNNNPIWANGVQQILDFNMSIGTISLYETPRIEWSFALLIPAFSILATILSSYLSMRNSFGFHDRDSMRSGIALMAASGIMFTIFSFVFPFGFSIYWGFSCLIDITQSFLLKKTVKAKSIIAEHEAKIAEKKQALEYAEMIEVKMEDGTSEWKKLSSEEIAERRLLKARKLDAKRFREE